jgi:hypothetical protein
LSFATAANIKYLQPHAHRYGHDVLDRWGPKSLELDRSRDRIQPFQGWSAVHLLAKGSGLCRQMTAACGAWILESA